MSARSDAADERKAAYHEGGHAVVAIELKIPFTKVDIIGDEDAGGRIHHHKKHTRVTCDSDWIERRILVCLAGGMAERRYAPRSDWSWSMGHKGLERDIAPCYDVVTPSEPKTFHAKISYGSDLDHINKWLDKLGYYGDRKARDACRSRLEARARALVRELWPEIKIVAAALLKEKVLSCAQVRKLMIAARR